MKVFEIDDETGQQVEVDENGNPVAKTSPIPEPQSTTQETIEGRYEPSSPPPEPAFTSSYWPLPTGYGSTTDQTPYRGSYTPMPEDYGSTPGQTPHGCSYWPLPTEYGGTPDQTTYWPCTCPPVHDDFPSPPDQTSYGGHSNQQHQFSTQETRQDDYTQLPGNELRRSKEKTASILEQHLAHHLQQEAYPETQFNCFRPRIYSANNSFLGGPGIGIGASHDFSRVGGPGGGPTAFGDALHSAYGNNRGNPFAPSMPFTRDRVTGTANGQFGVYGAPNLYSVPSVGRGAQNPEFRQQPTMFERPDRVYYGEFANGGAEQEAARFGNSDEFDRLVNSEYQEYLRRVRAGINPEAPNENATGHHSRRFDGRGQPDSDQQSAYRGYRSDGFGGSQQ